MPGHATHTRRRVIGSALTGIAAVCGAGLVGRRAVDAVGVLVDEPATSGTATAQRWSLDRGLAFPVDPTGGLVVFDNFGGYSASSGACGHRGVDIWRADRAPGQPLVACTDGVLAGQRTDLGMAMGLAWILRHADGTSYRYHHLAAFAPGLAVGDRVRKGQVIGTMGSTGNAGAGVHLHFEVRLGGTTPIDPMPLLRPLPGGVVVGAVDRC